MDPLSPNSSIYLTPSHTPQITSQLLSPTSISASQSQFAPTGPQRAASPRHPPQRQLPPRLGSPQPSAVSSNPSFKTAHSTLSTRTSGLSHPAKDFSYLLRPEIYHPLTLLDVPPPFRTAATQPSPSTPLTTLISTGHFRSAAITAASLLTTNSIPPSDHQQIFSLFYTRLSCLTLCNGTALAAQEVKALEDLNSAYYRDEETGSHLVPWELRVLAVRLQGMGFNDARRGVMGFYDLAREVRLSITKLKKSLRSSSLSVSPGNALSDEEKAAIESKINLLTSRLEDLGLRVASALIEMDDLEGASRHLKSLPQFSANSSTTSNLAMQKALLYLYLGDVDAARSSIPSSLSSLPSPPSSPTPEAAANAEEARDQTNTASRNDKIILALAHMSDADYADASMIWEDLISSTTVKQSETPMLQQNLAVCYLYLGRIEAVSLFALPLSLSYLKTHTSTNTQ